MGEQTEIPDTTNWKTADDPDYIHAQHVAENVGSQLAHRYSIIGHQSGQDTTDSPNKVVKFTTISSKNAQNKDETDYYLKIEVDTPDFKYVIAHVGVTPECLVLLYETWTTNT